MIPKLITRQNPSIAKVFDISLPSWRKLKLEQSASISVVLNRQCVAEYCNRSWIPVAMKYGMPMEIAGRSLFEILPERWVDPILRFLKKCMEGAAVQNVTCVVCTDRILRMLEFQVLPVLEGVAIAGVAAVETEIPPGVSLEQLYADAGGNFTFCERCNRFQDPKGGSWHWIPSFCGPESTAMARTICQFCQSQALIANAVEDTESVYTPVKLREGTKTILVVEDEARLRDSICEYLRSAGYNVLQAASGHDAVTTASKHSEEINVLLTDVVMPKMSGRELSQILSGLRPGMETLFMSGYMDDSVLRSGVESGLAFLQKPFSVNTLGAKVGELIARQSLICGARRKNNLGNPLQRPHARQES